MEYFRIGKIVAVHGLDGKMIVEHSLGNNKGWKETTVIFMEENKDNLLPWFLTSVNTGNKAGRITIGVEDITTREAAQALLKKSVWITEKDYRRIVSDNTIISMLGFKVYDREKYLGVIAEIVEQSVQPTIKVVVNGKDVWIPLHKDLILKSDVRQKKLFMQLPEGLLDVYLE